MNENLLHMMTYGFAVAPDESSHAAVHPGHVLPYLDRSRGKPVQQYIKKPINMCSLSDKLNGNKKSRI